MTTQDLPEIMTSGEVADLFRVDAATVSRWAWSGKLTAFRTPAVEGRSHYRFRRDDVMALLNGGAREEAEAHSALAVLGELLDGHTTIEFGTEADGVVTVTLISTDTDRRYVHVHGRTPAEALLAAHEEAGR